MAMTDTLLPAGRELDALVAEKLDLPRLLIRPFAEQHPPQYSTSWDAMRLVVERLVALGWTVTVRAMEGNATCWLVDRQPGRSTVYEHGDTAPHAVALAALKAVEGQA